MSGAGGGGGAGLLLAGGGGIAVVSRRNGLRKERLVVAGAGWLDRACPGSAWLAAVWGGIVCAGNEWLATAWPEIVCGSAAERDGAAASWGALRCWAEPQKTQISHSLRTRLPQLGQVCCN